MSYLHLTRTRTRDRSPSPLPLIRRDTKRSRLITLSDDEDSADDYPYSSSHRPVRTSRALTLRNQPSQLERYNIWSDRHASPGKSDGGDVEYEREREWRFRRERAGGHHHGRHGVSDDDECDPEERAFRLNLKASLSTRPSTSHHHHHHSHHTHSPLHHHHSHSHSHHLHIPTTLHRKDKWVDENYEERSRSRSRSRDTSLRRDSFWGEGGFWGDEKCEKKESEDENEMLRRYRKVKRTRTEEWRPLVGWRRV